jgi:hypothetical protein
MAIAELDWCSARAKPLKEQLQELVEVDCKFLDKDGDTCNFNNNATSAQKLLTTVNNFSKLLPQSRPSKMIVGPKSGSVEGKSAKRKNKCGERRGVGNNLTYPFMWECSGNLKED